ncbi:thiamine phosphate synthase [Paraburkholderia sediminicola]|uniref:thiamine phosphate synthase n=1 Tax=Paraburkholderia sediminicola TaxID=458836 RepID=UPI0038B7FF9B
MYNKKFPEKYLITPEPICMDLTTFKKRLSVALLTGIELVQLRSKEMDSQTYVKLAEEVLHICHVHGARLILNGPNCDLGSTLVDGMHLSSERLMACTLRPFPSTGLVSAACHSLDQLLHAQNIGIDFVTLSPVLATTSHPDARPIGWQRFADLVSPMEMPIYALGGMTRNHIVVARSHGACGIAAITGLW